MQTMELCMPGSEVCAYNSAVEAAFAESGAAMFVIELESGLIVQVNNQLCIDLGYTPQQFIGKMYGDVFWPEVVRVFNRLVHQSTYEQIAEDVYYWPDRAIWGYFSVRRARMEALPDVAVVTITNITEVARSDLSYRNIAFYDRQLTLPNGLKLEEDVAAIRDFYRVALVHFDIERFDDIHEVYGWDTIDYLLLQVRDWMLSTAVSGCVLYRIGEGRFAMVIRDISFKDAQRRVEQVLARFEQPWAVDPDSDLVLYCTIALGLVYGEYVRGDIRNQLYRTMHAEDNLRGYALYDAAEDEKIKEDFQLRQELVNAIRQDMRGFRLVYQPIVDPASGQWKGVEALCRWTSLERGPVPPGIFIEAIEQMRLVEQLDRWVMNRAIQECCALGLDRRDFFLDINLSPVQTLRAGYVDEIFALLENTGFPRKKLSIEVTESSKFDFSGENMELLQRIHSRGVQISLDDFGTGYSNFSNLKNLPAHTLKVDKSMIDTLVEEEYSRYLVRMMVDLAHTAGMQVVVEGVEDADQKDLLVEYGADYIQGYYYSKPLEVENLRGMLDCFAAERQ